MALNLKKKFALNVDATVSGAKMDLGDGAYFLVARWGNKKHAALLEQLREPYRDKIELGVKLTDEESEGLMVKGIAGGVLVGWGGITGLVDPNDETEVAYSPALAEAMLLDKEFEDLRGRVVTFSMNAANYRKAATKATEKNSSASSNGKKNTART